MLMGRSLVRRRLPHTTMLTPWPVTFDPSAENPWHVHTSTEHVTVTSQCIVTRDSCKLRLRRFLCSEKLVTKETKKILLFIEMIHNLQHHHVFRETLPAQYLRWSEAVDSYLLTVCMFTRKHRHLNRMGLDTKRSSITKNIRVQCKQSAMRHK